MSKGNCWEFKKCGREPGGAKTAELGVCLASISREYHGVNGGTNGGRFCWFVTGTFCGGTCGLSKPCAGTRRFCWFVTGTFCGGQVQGTFAQKRLSCLSCEFLQKVREEEGSAFTLSR